MFIHPRWRKVFRDLWLNKTRTLLVVFSIAVGVFAVGVIINAQLVLSKNLRESYLASNPAHATIMVVNPFDEDLIESIRNIDAVAEADARRSVTVRVQTGPDQWRNLMLMAIPDYEDTRVSKVSPEAGAWPPEEREILIERSAMSMLGLKIGDMATIKTPSGRERQVRIAGTSHDLQAIIYVLGGFGYGHVGMNTLEWLEEPRNFNEVHLRAAGENPNMADVRAAANQTQDKIEESGRTILFTLIPEPDVPPLNYVIQAILGILGAIGVLALILSGFLVVNTISAILTQQTQQIGIMKAIGARTSQMVQLYVVMVLMFGVLALVIAVPLSLIVAYGLTHLLASMLNFDVDAFRVAPLALILQVTVALLVPLVAGLFPIFNGAKITVNEAINVQGLGKGRFGSSFIDRWLTSDAGRKLLRFFTRPTIISLRNTFRRKKRLFLTLATLIMGGTIFIAVSSLQASLRSTLDSWLDYYQYDVALQMSRPYRIEQIQRALQDVPDVVDVEGWGFYTGRRLRPDGTNSDNITVFAPSADTTMVKPTLVEGRWLLPDDENAIVLSTLTLRTESDIEIGDEIILKIEGKEVPWRVVGLVQGGSISATAFVTQKALARVTGQVGQAEWIMVSTTDHSREGQQRMLRIIEDHLTDSGFRIGLSATASMDRDSVAAIFQIIFVLLLVMAIVLALVGGLGLMGTMSINVLERTREIGVMRAVGASNGSILRIVLFEGIFIGGISWIVGAVLSLPISQVLSDAVGSQLLQSDLSYTFSIAGAVGWLVLVTILAAVASYLPAWNAARLTVQEVLAYE